MLCHTWHGRLVIHISIRTGINEAYFTTAQPYKREMQITFASIMQIVFWCVGGAVKMGVYAAWLCGEVTFEQHADESVNSANV